MSDEINDLLSGLENQSFKIDLSFLAVQALQHLIENKELLRTILSQQLEIKEILKGAPNDLNEIVDKEYSDLMEKISELTKKELLAQISRMTKG